MSQSIRFSTFYPAIFSLIFLNFSCTDPENPVIDDNPGGSANSTVTISSILLENVSGAPANKFQDELEISFEGTDDGKKYFLKIPANQNPINKTIELATGDYTYTYLSSSRNETSSVAEISIKGSFKAEKDNQELVLKGNRLNKRIRVASNQPIQAPSILLENAKPLFEASLNNFYIYHNLNGRLEIKIPIGNTGKFITQFDSNTESNIESAYRIEFNAGNSSYQEGLIKINSQNQVISLSPSTINSLETSQNETSGLAFINGRLFSINDGENPNQIHELNASTGEVLRNITVTNASNVDWEDLAQSETHLFIGDFGNNLGNRKDLVIYRVSIAELLNQDNLTAEQIKFNYPNQTDFSGSSENHRFDCEAMIFYQNKLHLFSKNRGFNNSDHYVLPAIPGDYEAELVETFSLNALVTGADINRENGEISLIGFRFLGLNPLEQAIWISEGIREDQKLNNFYPEIKIGYIPIRGFPEGIVYQESGHLLISSERFVLEGVYNIPATLAIIGLEGSH
ncbi:MAG TPA: hypothetical protein DEQ87_10830 [Algoriphagus sp.]|jgi:hypothetical protein|uniref:hypothetical protein n=3 Tax=Cyclobacteriaceae TaxID=563798 RepID=UPI000C4F9B93|nr:MULTISPECIES: hypothetical protein [Algoriphagus]MAL15236.1 hypothetical protein [Algoriphagus sp.]MAN86885.1 hypothetical protein [Algoriphagus sp.]QYH37862.1 hypothetical protein GYM62_03260 [Algoriphagus sp. NBT04N3]HAH39201.1 hypothetical protein [Algoriphagus sp.]HCD88114.1 hypothetical protein [Algoriphagus sp.]|tara:strand:+ start:301 stop:1842 length:1542 start_codon:yes stop_codon:yes gene_type:complete